MDSKIKSLKGMALTLAMGAGVTAGCAFSDPDRRELSDEVAVGVDGTAAEMSSPERVAITTIEAVRGNLTEVRAILADARGEIAKGVAADLIAFGTDLDAAEQLLHRADDALFEGDFPGADSLAVSAAEAVGAGNGDVALL